MLFYSSETCPKWSIYEIRVQADVPADPFAPGTFGATAETPYGAKTVPGFYDGNGAFVVRFMPEEIGTYRLITFGAATAEYTFTAVEPLPGVHGPSRVEGTGFRYADGTRCLPYGTTCYAWAHQSDELRAATLKTLETAPFNKMRMCIFPKHYRFNLKDPKIAPFTDGDTLRPDPAYFRWIEESVAALADMNIIADIILFHPYDRWGYSKMSKEADDRYLHYVIARLSAFHNIWWAMSNEYDLFFDCPKDWRHLGELVRSIDPYGHPRSNHNCLKFYDHSEDWITHCSLQRIDVYRHVEYTDELLNTWKKPIVWDEIAYEGNIPDGWGSITGEELTRRYWESMVRGGYPGHAETVLTEETEDAVLWWAHGGELRGESPARIAFLRGIHESQPENCTFWQPGWDLIATRKDDDYYLFYHSFMRPLFRHYPVKRGAKYRVEVIDTWNMTIEDKGIMVGGDPAELQFVLLPPDMGYIKVDLPGTQYIAVRVTRAD